MCDHLSLPVKTKNKEAITKEILVINWASTRENLSLGVCEQHRRRPACASAQTDQRLCYSLGDDYVSLLSTVSGCDGTANPPPSPISLLLFPPCVCFLLYLVVTLLIMYFKTLYEIVSPPPSPISLLLFPPCVCFLLYLVVTLLIMYFKTLYEIVSPPPSPISLLLFPPCVCFLFYLVVTLLIMYFKTLYEIVSPPPSPISLLLFPHV